MDTRPVFHVLGALLVILSLAMLLPALLDLWDQNYKGARAFLFSAAITLFSGGTLYLSSHQKKAQLNVRQTFLVTTVVWFGVALFGALPFRLGDFNLTLVDALFESVSGITTTGSTVVTGLDNLPRGFLIWRALLQWLGGVGIIVMAVSLLPLLQVGGMQMFRAEGFEQSDKILPRAKEIAFSVLLVYIGITILGALLLRFSSASMSSFDAIAHAMTAVATGGFSTHDQSISYFESFAVDIVIWLLMLLGSLPFMMLLAAVYSRFSRITIESQARVFLLMIALLGVFMAWWLMKQGIAENWLTALRLGFFNTTSIVTGTGFATQDYSSWGSLSQMLFLAIMFIGGCAGSTTCGIKIFRFQILFATAYNQLRQLVEPRGIFVARYEGRPISEDITKSVLGFIFLFLISFVSLALLLGLVTDLDFIALISTAATALCNVGPAIGSPVGPAGNFSSLSDAAKLIMAFGMMLGRLEIYSILILLLPNYWRG